jgi:hypothetical protein
VGVGWLCLLLQHSLVIFYLAESFRKQLKCEDDGILFSLQRFISSIEILAFICGL